MIRIDCYLAEVMEVKQTGEWIPTIDTSDGKCYTGKRQKSKALAEIQLMKLKKELSVNLVDDPRKTSAALTTDERKLVYSCMLNKIDYKTKLLESRVNKKYFTVDKLDSKDQLIIEKEISLISR